MFIDLGFLLFAMYGMYLGFKRGILRTLIALASIIIGIVLALKLSPYVIAFAQDFFKSTSIIVVIGGFLVTYFAIIAIIRLIGNALEKGLKKVRLNFINKAIGGLLLTVFFVFVYSMLIYFLEAAELISNQARAKSITYPLIDKLPGVGKEALADIEPFFQEFWDVTRETVDEFGESE